MISLNTSSTLKLKLTSNIINQLEWNTNYIDTSTDNIDHNQGLSDSLNDVILVNSPSSESRTILDVGVHNPSTNGAVTLEIKRDNGSDQKILLRTTIESGKSISYNSNKGWYQTLVEPISSYTDADSIDAINNDVGHGANASHTKSDVGLGNVPNIDTTNAVSKAHTQNSDSILNEGGANEVSAFQCKGAVTHSDGDGSDHSDVVLNTTHRGKTDNPHSVTKTQVGLNNVDNVQQIPLSQKGQADGVATLDSSGKVPVSQLTSSVENGIRVIGSWNASSNTPNLNGITPNDGEAYLVSVSGSTDINGETNWKVRDLIAWLDSQWIKLDNTDDVLSVSGKTGIVTLVKDDVGLANVTNDAQLKRSANDIASFTQEQNPNTAYKLLAERDTDGVKRSLTIADIIGADTGHSNVYVDYSHGNDTTGNGSVHKPFKTISHSLSSITDNSSSKRYRLVLVTGTHIIGSVTMKPYVSIIGQTASGCIIASAITSGNSISLASYTTLEKVTITGNTGGVAIFDATNTATSLVKDVIIDNCSVGFKSTGSSEATILNIQLTSSVDIGIYGTNTVPFTGAVVSGILSKADITAQCDSGLLRLFTLGIYGGTTSLFANGGILDIHSICQSSCPNCVKTDNGGSVTGFGFDMHYVTGWHIQQLDPTDTVNIFSAQFNQDQLYLVNPDNIKLDFNDTKLGDEGLTLYKELHVGSPNSGAITVLGEGGSYTRGLLAYTETTSNVFTDISSKVKSQDSSTFSFTGVASGNSIYIASSLNNNDDKLKFYGLKAIVQTAGVMGSGAIAIKYWNGTSWQSVHNMSTKSTTPYIRYAEELFQRDQSEQVRLSWEFLDSWSKNDPMSLGTDYYWIKIEIESSITTAPVFEQFKLHTSKYKINGDGFPEYYGNGRPIGNLGWKITDSVAFGSSPSDADMWLYNDSSSDKDIACGRTENIFSGSTVDRIGNIFTLPPDLDTSCPIRLTVYWTNSSNSGDVLFVANAGISRDGTRVGAGSTSTNNPSNVIGYTTQRIATTVPATTRTQKRTIIDLDISKAKEDDLIWLTLARDGGDSADTNDSNTYALQIKAEYTKWADGGHI